jgi:hypothetical protein
VFQDNGVDASAASAAEIDPINSETASRTSCEHTCELDIRKSASKFPAQDLQDLTELFIPLAEPISAVIFGGRRRVSE